jgi:hypothetical protein
MKSGFTLSLVFAVALAAGLAAWYGLRPSEAPRAASSAAPAPAASSDARQEKLAASAVLSIDPRAHSFSARPTVARQSVFNEYLAAGSYRDLYDRLRGSAEGETAEGKLVLYEILRQCAAMPEGRRPGYRAPPPAKREQFLANLATEDPNRAKRIAAFEAFNVDHCAGFSDIATTQADLAKLLAEAAAAGSPQAKAIAVEQDLWAARRGGNLGSANISDAQIETLKQVLQTKDPEAIRVAGRVLANSWNDYALRIGPDQQPVEQRALVNAFLVLACEYGAPCGADTPRLEQACAYQGHCDATNFPDYLYYYGSTPHDSQLLVQYRSIVQHAIETGDWSQLTVVRGVPASPNRVTFVPGPR